MFLVDKSIISYDLLECKRIVTCTIFNAEKIQNFQTGFERQRTA